MQVIKGEFKKHQLPQYNTFYNKLRRYIL